MIGITFFSVITAPTPTAPSNPVLCPFFLSSSTLPLPFATIEIKLGFAVPHSFQTSGHAARRGSVHVTIEAHNGLALLTDLVDHRGNLLDADIVVVILAMDCEVQSCGDFEVRLLFSATGDLVTTTFTGLLAVDALGHEAEEGMHLWCPVRASLPAAWGEPYLKIRPLVSAAFNISSRGHIDDDSVE